MRYVDKVRIAEVMDKLWETEGTIVSWDEFLKAVEDADIPFKNLYEVRAVFQHMVRAGMIKRVDNHSGEELYIRIK